MKDYWRAISIDSNQLAYICQLDSNHQYVGNKYIYREGRIKSVVYVERGMELYRMKSFSYTGTAMVMTEFDRNGNQIYFGNFLNDISKDYPREGIGFEYAGVKTLVYNGEWKNGQPYKYQ